MLISLAFGSASLARGDFEPLLLTADSYNQDVVVEKAAPPPAGPVTTASMEQGISNTGFSWFERGYVADWPMNGLPLAGSVFESLQSADHQYQMAPSYQAANAFLIDADNPSTTISLTDPSNYAVLSFLTSSGLAANTIQYTVRYGDRGSESGGFVSPSWYGNQDPAWAGNGRVDVATFAHADLNVYNPRLYSIDVKLANVRGPITAVELSLGSGNGHTAVFALSGATAPGEVFQPITLNGYQEDLVVEAGAVQPGFLDTNTTATMDNGAVNTRFTWFEKGYYSAAPEAGLPSPGSLITSDAEPDHRFALPASYTDNNAILLDATCSNAVLTLLSPLPCSTLSFLTAASQGPVTNECVIRHSNGSYETNWFVAPDWLGSAPAALTAHGRVSVSTKLMDRINADAPRLYSVDLPVTDSKIPITKILLSPIDAGSNARTIVFAVSGIVLRPLLSIVANGDGHLTIRSTQPGALQSCASFRTTAVVWKDEGQIIESLDLPPSSGSTRFFRVVSRQ